MSGSSEAREASLEFRHGEAREKEIEHNFAVLLTLLKEAELSPWRPVIVVDETECLVRLRNPARPTDGMYLQLRFMLPMTYEDAVTFYRPEATVSEDGPFNRNYIENMKVIEWHRPGMVVYSLGMKPWLASLMALLGGLYPAVECDDISSNSGQAVPHRHLFALRRDFPAADSSTLAGIAQDDAHGSLKKGQLFWCLLRRFGATTEVIEILEIGLSPDLVLQALAQFRGRMFPVLPHPNIKECRQNYDFLIVSMRKCCRGVPLWPLLPSTGDGSESSGEWIQDLVWVDTEEGVSFQLPAYLRHLLALANPEYRPMVADSYDGRKLVWYQACIPIRDWEAVNACTGPLFRKHQSVYRKRRGGSAAPFVQVNVEPRYISQYTTVPWTDLPFDQTSVSTTSSGADWPRDHCSELPVKNTFLHFPEL